MKTLLLTLLALPAIVHAADGEWAIAIKDHQFQPTEIHVPAGQKIVLVINNQDPTAEEFESYELNREKTIPGNSRDVIFLGPLEPGRYPFFGDLNPKTAKGVLIAQ